MLVLVGQAARAMYRVSRNVACLALPCLACTQVLALDVARFLAPFFLLCNALPHAMLPPPAPL
jgi:hypothetical protein